MWEIGDFGSMWEMEQLHLFPEVGRPSPDRNNPPMAFSLEMGHRKKIIFKEGIKKKVNFSEKSVDKSDGV